MQAVGLALVGRHQLAGQLLGVLRGKGLGRRVVGAGAALVPQGLAAVGEHDQLAVGDGGPFQPLVELLPVDASDQHAQNRPVLPVADGDGDVDEAIAPVLDDRLVRLGDVRGRKGLRRRPLVEVAPDR